MQFKEMLAFKVLCKYNNFNVGENWNLSLYFIIFFVYDKYQLLY